MLRHAKLTVADEIENALSYYQTTFLREIPRLYRDIERALPGHEVAPFFRMGNWIGGDRDGNPNVGAATLRVALARQSETALRFYLTELHALGSELSLSASLTSVTPQMQALADASPDRSEHRSDEPYRRALTGMYARLAATLRELTGTEALRHALAPQNPYADAAELLADLRHDPRLARRPPGAGAGRAAARAAAARGAGVRLPPRQRRPAAELGQARGGGRRAAARTRASSPTTPALGEDDAARAAARRARRRAAAARAGRRVLAARRRRAGGLRDGARAARAPRRRRRAPLHHLAHRGGERPARSAGAAEGGRPRARHARRARGRAAGGGRPHRLAAVRDHRRPAPGGADHARVLRPARHRRHGAGARAPATARPSRT